MYLVVSLCVVEFSRGLTSCMYISGTVWGCWSCKECKVGEAWPVGSDLREEGGCCKCCKVLS